MHKLAMVLALACAASAQPQAKTVRDPLALLKDVARVSNEAKTTFMEGDMQMEVSAQGMSQKFDLPVSIAVAPPGKMRFESAHPVFGSMLVSDGASTWMYVPLKKQYFKFENASTAGSSGMGGMNSDLTNFAKMAEYLKSAKFLEDERVGGADCWVLEVEFNLPAAMKTVEMSPARLAVDKKRLVIWRMNLDMKAQAGGVGSVGIKLAMTFRTVKLNEPLDDSQFVFKIPEGATEAQAGAEILTKPAPDFDLTALDGKRYRPADLRGKTVVLVFWASTFTHCDTYLPVVEKVYADAKAKGVVVVAVNIGESEKIIQEYAASKKLSYPIATAADPTTIGAYQVLAFPTTVVIDKDGKVSQYIVGAVSESRLRSALK